MINPIKRAIIMLGVAVVIILAAYFIPVVKNSKMDNFFKGGAVGFASVAILMLAVAYIQRPKATE